MLFVIGRWQFSFLIIVLFCYLFNCANASLSRISDDLVGDSFVALKEVPLAGFPHSSINNGIGLGTANGTETMRGRITRNTSLPCRAHEVGKSQRISWWKCGSKCQEIGYMTNGKINMLWPRNGSYDIIPENASLLLIDCRRELVNRYECRSIYKDGSAIMSAVDFRLDFSFWYDHRWDSLFYGSCLSSFVFCVLSFILNLLWIGCRKVVLWWINRAERNSRVRCMVEAVEKYKTRQIENLHETYHRQVSAIRDNYHQQVEQIRASYANQAGRFRGYRQARMDNVTQHLDNIRENYNQQLNRMREYGSRRTENLWVSYERQVNKIRTFTLQQRLKLMNQYKVKQRYINKLLEAIGESSSPDAIEKREAEIRAALDLPDTSLPHASFSRSASYYSLPEFVIEDDYDYDYRPSTSGGGKIAYGGAEFHPTATYPKQPIVSRASAIMMSDYAELSMNRFRGAHTDRLLNHQNINTTAQHRRIINVEPGGIQTFSPHGSNAVSITVDVSEPMPNTNSDEK